MPKIDLLPCPFCGKIETPKMFDIQDSVYHVICDVLIGGCGASTGLNYTTPEEAAEEWNTRTPGWVPCSAKLPEVGEPVLIYEPYNDEMVVASLDCDKMGFSNDDYYYGLKNVPFWMQLPEKPKEVHHDEN